MSAVALVQMSVVDLSRLLPIGRQGLDRNLAEEADNAAREPPLHHFLCVAALKDPGARAAEDIRPFLHMFHAGMLIAIDERDAADVLEVASMPNIVVETTNRDIIILYITGTLSQWRDAISRSEFASVPVKRIYELVVGQFRSAGLECLKQ